MTIVPGEEKRGVSMRIISDTIEKGEGREKSLREPRSPTHVGQEERPDPIGRGQREGIGGIIGSTNFAPTPVQNTWTEGRAEGVPIVSTNRGNQTALKTRVNRGTHALAIGGGMGQDPEPRTHYWEKIVIKGDAKN